MKKTFWEWARPIATYSLLAALLYFALRNAPLIEIWKTLRKLQFWQIIALLVLNVIIYILITLRWWLIVRAEKKRCFLFSIACHPRGCVWGQLFHTRSAGGWGAASSFVFAAQLWHDLHPRHIHGGDG